MKLKSVALPERSVIVRSKSGQYVYLTESVTYSKELKCSRPTRVSIGKLDDEGLLIPNKNYLRIFGEHVELEVAPNRSDCIVFGPHFIVDAIAKKTEVKMLLESIFEDKASKLLDIASYMIMNGTNVMQYFEDYGFNHSLFSKKNFDDNVIGRLLQEISTKDIDLFIRSWVQMHNQKKVYVAYDSTNMNSVAGNLELAEYGHAKDDPEKPQVNVSVGYDQTNQIPLFYELFPGSIIDNAECQKMVERAVSYGCKDIGFILDRGYFSMRNIRYFEKNGYDYILMSKGNAMFIREVIEEYGAILKNGYTHYLDEYELYGTTIETTLFSSSKKQYVHVYYNGQEAEKEKIQINKQFQKKDEELQDRVGKKLQRKEEVQSYEKYYKLRYDENGYFQNYQRKDREIRKLIERAGFFTIVTSKKMEAKRALELYRDRDAVEKIFRMEKSYLGCDVFRVHTDEKLESKVFVSFIALIMRNEIYKQTKELYKKNRKEYTVPKVLQEMNRLRLVKLGDEKYHLRYVLTKKQKTILKALGNSEEEYYKFSDKLKDLFNQMTWD